MVTYCVICGFLFLLTGVICFYCWPWVIPRGNVIRMSALVPQFGGQFIDFSRRRGANLTILLEYPMLMMNWNSSHNY